MQERLRQVTTLTDTDITDELAGEMRSEMAKGIEERKQRDRQELKRQNTESGQRIANATAAVETDLGEIEASRASCAASSQQRKVRGASFAARLPDSCSHGSFR